VEFFDSLDELPKIFESIEVGTIGIDREQPTTRVSQDHVEEWGGCLLEINGGPQGWIAESGASPVSADASERK
jgi:hypothetical protein